MNRLTHIALFLLLGVAPSFAAEPVPKVKASAPIKEFRLPLFDKAGLKTAYMRASEGLFVSSSQIDVTDMQVTLFTKDGTGGFETVLLAPTASFRTDKQIVSGKDTMRLIRLDLEVTGEQWSYNHTEKRVLIAKNARVTFQEELNDIIK